MRPCPIRCVLFDLDGTLIDSAPDLAGAANAMRVARGMPEVPYPHLRAMVGSGARGMIGAAFDVGPGDAGFDDLRSEFLDLYERMLLQRTSVFEAMHPVLDALDAAALRWGIVTNKAERFAAPVIGGLGLDRRAAAVVCGDTTPFSKPHPEPLLEAARRLDSNAGACVYVGDDLRDVQAGRSAGMATVAAAWGYLGAGEPIDRWGADAVIEHPAELLQWLGLA